jgi:hypothetical protein
VNTPKFAIDSGPTYFVFDITPFDSSLGTLNNVTMYAEVNVSGTAQLWSLEEYSTLSYESSATLDPITEMGWDDNVASFNGSELLYNPYYDLGWEAVLIIPGSDNTAVLNTIYTDFGRFAGADLFQIGLTLAGEASSTGLYDYVEFTYDGNATLSYEYDYTPASIPEPAATLLLGIGLVGIAAFRRFKK